MPEPECTETLHVCGYFVHSRSDAEPRYFGLCVEHHPVNVPDFVPETPDQSEQCGHCKLGGQWVEINEACEVHGDHDGLSW